MIDDHLADMGHARCLVDRILGIEQGVAIFRRGIYHREIENLVGGIELGEQIEDLIDHPAAAGGRLVDFVDDNDDRKVILQGFFQNKVGLRHRSFLGIDKEQGTISHAQDALYLPAKIGVAGGINDIDPIILVLIRAVLGSDGNAALPFQIHGVHHSFGDFLVVAEHTGLFEKLVHQGCFTMINVGNNRHVTNLLLFHPASFKASKHHDLALSLFNA